MKPCVITDIPLIETVVGYVGCKKSANSIVESERMTILAIMKDGPMERTSGLAI
jgi:hypothetical protein